MVYMVKLTLSEAAITGVSGVACFGVSYILSSIAQKIDRFIETKLEIPTHTRASNNQNLAERSQTSLSEKLRRLAVKISAITGIIFTIGAFIALYSGIGLVFYSIIGPLLV